MDQSIQTKPLTKKSFLKAFNDMKNELSKPDACTLIIRKRSFDHHVIKELGYEKNKYIKIIG